MKNNNTFKFLPLLAGLLVTCITAHGQVINPKASAQDNASNRANSRVDQGVDKGLDKVEKGIGGIFKKKHKKPDSTATATAAGSESSPVAVKVIVVVNYNEADAKSKGNATRITALVQGTADKPVTYYLFDQSTDASKKVSGKVIDLLGMHDLQDGKLTAGTVVLVNANSHEVIKSVSLDVSSRDFTKYLQQSLK